MPKASNKEGKEAGASGAEGKPKWELFGHGGANAQDGAEDKIQGVGFKDKAKAIQTLAILDGRDVSYQQLVIATMTRRAQSLVKRTKDPAKIKDMEEAIAVFQEWLDDYKANNRSKENLGYLPLETLEAYEPLAKHYQSDQKGGSKSKGSKKESEKSFLEIFRQVEGDLKKLRTMPIRKKEDEEETVKTWDIYRNENIKAMLDSKQDLYHESGQLKGLPTRYHVGLIMWAYSPDPAKVKKSASNVATVIK